MKSMTGYAYRELSKDGVTVSAEIKSYNSRFLDLSIHLSPWLSSLEPEIRKYINSRFARGKIDIYIKVKEENPSFTVTVNKNAALSYSHGIDDLAKSLGLNEKPGLGLLLGLEGVLEIETNRDTEKFRPLIDKVLAEASDHFDLERSREGEHTREDIISHIKILEESLKIVSSHGPEIEAGIKENLRSRFSELLGDKIDENRILAETAVLLMKFSISEEISRLSSHLKEFLKEMEGKAGRDGSQGGSLGSGPSTSLGKKLDFLSQEINREINTIGSKTPVLEVSLAVVEMKNALENIREQLRNVE